MSMASSAILSNFFEEQYIQNQSQYLSGLSRTPFPTTVNTLAYQARSPQSKRDNSAGRVTLLHGTGFLHINVAQCAT